MAAKSKMGMGLLRTKMKNKKRSNKIKKKTVKNNLNRGDTFMRAVKNARKSIKLSKVKDPMEKIRIGLAAAKNSFKKTGTAFNSRVIPIPKTGGILPFLVPIFAALSAAGSIAGGVSGIVKAVNEAADAKRKLQEAKRHNATMESIGQKGNGFYLKPIKLGYGLYLKPKNFQGGR